MRIALAAALAILFLIDPAHAAPTTVNVSPENLHDREIGQGIDLLRAGKPQEAVALMDKVIAAYEAAYPSGINLCANDLADALLASSIATAAQAKAPPRADGKPVMITVLGPGWCMALWAKGFGLIDLQQSPLAEPALAKAVEMAPTNAHYANEYAELFKSRREWQHSYELFGMAWDRANHDPKSPDAPVAARALRGMGYNKIELGDLKEAKRLFEQSQQFEPDSRAARVELDYIARKLAAGS